MDPSGVIGYKVGKIYKCEETGCITDEQGDSGHTWSDVGAKKEHFRDIESHRNGIIERLLTE